MTRLVRVGNGTMVRLFLCNLGDQFSNIKNNLSSQTLHWQEPHASVMSFNYGKISAQSGNLDSFYVNNSYYLHTVGFFSFYEPI